PDQQLSTLARKSALDLPAWAQGQHVGVDAEINRLFTVRLVKGSHQNRSSPSDTWSCLHFVQVPCFQVTRPGGAMQRQAGRIVRATLGHDQHMRAQSVQLAL